MKLQNKKQINAPIEKVWKATLDITNWPTWAPPFESIETSDTSLRVGQEAWIKLHGQKKAKWIISEMSESKVKIFKWFTKAPGIKIEAVHILTPEGESTENLLELNISGFLGLILGPLLKAKLSQNLELENQGLKQFCE